MLTLSAHLSFLWLKSLGSIPEYSLAWIFLNDFSPLSWTRAGFSRHSQLCMGRAAVLLLGLCPCLGNSVFGEQTGLLPGLHEFCRAVEASVDLLPVALPNLG